VLKAIPEIKIVLGNEPQTLPMYMNTSRVPLNDPRVRQAIVYAIDKKDLVDKFTGGSATVAWADQPPYSEYYNPNVTKYQFDIAKAKALLAQAGYTPGPGGILRKNGQPLTLQLSYNVENVTRRLVSIQVQADLKQVGIDAQVKAYPANLFFGTFGQGGIMATAKYDLGIAGWIAGIDPDDHSLFASNQFPPAGTNYSHYNNKEMDALQQSALTTYDVAQRKKIYDRIQALIAQDVPEDYFWYTRFPQAINPAFKGFAPNPINEAWNAWQWEI